MDGRASSITWDIADRQGLSVYDGVYLAVAVALEAPLVTADRRLLHALTGSDLARHVLWIEDVA